MGDLGRRIEAAARALWLGRWKDHVEGLLYGFEAAFPELFTDPPGWIAPAEATEAMCRAAIDIGPMWLRDTPTGRQREGINTNDAALIYAAMNAAYQGEGE